MNSSSTRNLIIGVLIVALLIVAGFSLRHFIRAAGDHATSTATTTDLSSLDLNNISTTTVVNTPQGSYTITPITDNAPAIAAPNYKAPIAFSAQTDESVKAAINAQLKQTQDVIAGDKYNFQAWVNLGVLHKMGGDYSGAATIWRYVAAIYPSSTVPLDNLGGLYMDFLKNYAKAEANFKTSIALDPHDVHAYEALVDLYTTYGYKTKADAVTLIEQGLKNNPNDAGLLQLKAELAQ